MSVAHEVEDTLFEDAREVIAGNVRALMGRHKVSQVRLAAAMGKSQPAISRRLSGEVAMDTDELLFLARFFGVDLTDLLDAVRSRCFASLALVEPVPGQMELAFGEPPALAPV